MTMVVSPEVKSNFREDTLPQKPERTTEEVIIVGEDSHVESETKTYEDLFRDGMHAELYQLDCVLSFKVKNELVAQIFRSLGKEGFQVNIAAVTDIVRKELIGEQTRHFQSASELENATIPLASTRTEKRFDIPHYYTIYDLDNLQARSDIHTEISSRLAAIQATGEDGLFDITETYIQRLSIEARDEALEIVVRQKQELEIRNHENDVKIDELQDTISLLKTRLEMAHEEADVRNVPLPDQEVTLRLLTQDAYKYAA